MDRINQSAPESPQPQTYIERALSQVNNKAMIYATALLRAETGRVNGLTQDLIKALTYYYNNSYTQSPDRVSSTSSQTMPDLGVVFDNLFASLAHYGYYSNLNEQERMEFDSKLIRNITRLVANLEISLSTPTDSAIMSIEETDDVRDSFKYNNLDTNGASEEVRSKFNSRIHQTLREAAYNLKADGSIDKPTESALLNLFLDIKSEFNTLPSLNYLHSILYGYLIAAGNEKGGKIVNKMDIASAAIYSIYRIYQRINRKVPDSYWVQTRKEVEQRKRRTTGLRGAVNQLMNRNQILSVTGSHEGDTNTETRPAKIAIEKSVHQQLQQEAWLEKQEAINRVLNKIGKYLYVDDKNEAQSIVNTGTNSFDDKRLTRAVLNAAYRDIRALAVYTDITEEDIKLEILNHIEMGNRDMRTLALSNGNRLARIIYNTISEKPPILITEDNIAKGTRKAKLIAPIRTDDSVAILPITEARATLPDAFLSPGRSEHLVSIESNAKVGIKQFVKQAFDIMRNADSDKSKLAQCKVALIYNMALLNRIGSKMQLEESLEDLPEDISLEQLTRIIFLLFDAELASLRSSNLTILRLRLSEYKRYFELGEDTVEEMADIARNIVATIDLSISTAALIGKYTRGQDKVDATEIKGRIKDAKDRGVAISYKYLAFEVMRLTKTKDASINTPEILHPLANIMAQIYLGA